MPHAFPHHNLDAYKAARDFAVEAIRLTRSIPRGYADLRDQINRAALSTMRHIAEGACRWSPADKRARYILARGEVAECDASIEAAQMLELVDADAAQHARDIAGRTGALLTGLIRSQADRAQRS